MLSFLQNLVLLCCSCTQNLILQEQFKVSSKAPISRLFGMPEFSCLVFAFH